MHWRRLIRLRHAAVLIFRFEWESIDRPCVSTMSDSQKSDGARDRPSRGQDRFGLRSAAAALSLASLGEMTVSEADTANDAAIAQALSIGYECYRDDSPGPTDDPMELDPDYSPFPSKKIAGTDSKHKSKAALQSSAERSGAAAAAEVSSAASNGTHSFP